MPVRAAAVWLLCVGLISCTVAQPGQGEEPPGLAAGGPGAVGPRGKPEDVHAIGEVKRCSIPLRAGFCVRLAVVHALPLLPSDSLLGPP